MTCVDTYYQLQVTDGKLILCLDFEVSFVPVGYEFQ